MYYSNKDNKVHLIKSDALNRSTKLSSGTTLVTPIFPRTKLTQHLCFITQHRHSLLNWCFSSDSIYCSTLSLLQIWKNSWHNKFRTCYWFRICENQGYSPFIHFEFHSNFFPKMLTASLFKVELEIKAIKQLLGHREKKVWRW